MDSTVPVSVEISTTRPPTSGLVARELDQAGLHRSCPSTCTRTLEVHVDGACPDCGRPWAETTADAERGAA